MSNAAEVALVVSLEALRPVWPQEHPSDLGELVLVEPWAASVGFSVKE